VPARSRFSGLSLAEAPDSGGFFRYCAINTGQRTSEGSVVAIYAKVKGKYRAEFKYKDEFCA
jgi:hypothetical protein